MIVAATQEIVSEGRSRYNISSDIKVKEAAIEKLSRKYCKSDFSSDKVKQCLYSIGDNHAFLRTNRDPCDRMISNFDFIKIEYLLDYFHPTQVEAQYSLSIHYGKGGARLSHDHEKQVI